MKNIRNIKRFSFILAIILVMASLVACGTSQDIDQDNNTGVEENQGQDVGEDSKEVEFPLELEDDFGRKVSIEEAPERIISLAPSNTEILFALGLDEKIVGVTSFDNYPEEALEKEEIGNISEINMEKIVELEPDLVVAAGLSNQEDVEELEGLGIPVLVYDPNSIDETIETIKAIGEATDKVEEADSVTEEMEAKRDEIVEKVKDTEEVKVFYEIWHDPLQAAGPGSFMDELITLAGGSNVAGDADSAYAEYDLEQLVEKDPQVYLSADDGLKTVEDIKERPGYEDITAIREENIFFLDEDISSRAGPRIVEALELVAQAIYPEIFQ